MNAVGNKHRRENDRDGDDRPGDFLHAFQCRVLRRQSFLDVMLHDLDDDDGVVHHQTDGQHQAEQRERIDGETEQREKRERADQRNRHGEQRNQRRAPALQEDEDDDDDEDDGFHQRVLDLLHALGDGQRGVERDDVIQVRRKTLLEFFHDRLRAVGGVHGIGVRQLVEGDERGRLAVQARLHVVVLRAEFDAGDILHAQDRAAGIARA